jgi:hypothetical protein
MQKAFPLIVHKIQAKIYENLIKIRNLGISSGDAPTLFPLIEGDPYFVLVGNLYTFLIRDKLKTSKVVVSSLYNLFIYMPQGGTEQQ